MDFGFQVRMVIISLYTVFAAIVLYMAHWNKTRIKVGLLNLTIGVWLLGFDMLRIADSLPMVHLWSKVLFISAPLIILLAYSFSLDFLPTLNRLHKIQNVVFPLIYLLIILGFLFTESLLTGFNPQGSSLIEKAQPGAWFPLCLAFYLYVSAFYIYNLIKAYRLSNRRIQMQILYVATSTGICLLISIVCAGLLPVFGIEDFLWLSPYSSFLIALAMTYAIFKYRLLELDIFIQKLLAYLLVAFLVGIVNVTAIYLSIQLLGDQITFNHYLILMLTNVAIGLLIFADTPYFEKITRQLFFEEREKYYKALEHELKTCTVFINLSGLLGFIAKLLEEKMRITNVAIYLRDKNRDSNYCCGVKRGEREIECPAVISGEHVLVTYLVKNQDVLETGEFRHKYGHLYRNGKVLDREKYNLQEALDKEISAAIVLPIIQNEELNGLVVLGEKKSGFAYNTRDLQFLEKLGFDLSLTLENLKLKDRLVDKEKLALIGTIATSLAHEIHNPLTSVKSLVDMLPRKIGNKDYLDTFMSLVPKDIERVIGITKGLETFALPVPSMPTALVIKSVIEQALSLVQNQIHTSQVEIITEIEELPEIQADAKKITQLFVNIILNAIQASKAGQRILIEAKADDPSRIVVNVVDQGEGIKPEDIDKIFKPFYSTRIYGTGLGLPTCKMIVEDLQGEIKVDSSEGKGTNVTVILPVGR